MNRSGATVHNIDDLIRLLSLSNESSHRTYKKMLETLRGRLSLHGILSLNALRVFASDEAEMDALSITAEDRVSFRALKLEIMDSLFERQQIQVQTTPNYGPAATSLAPITQVTGDIWLKKPTPLVGQQMAANPRFLPSISASNPGLTGVNFVQPPPIRVSTSVSMQWSGSSTTPQMHVDASRRAVTHDDGDEIEEIGIPHQQQAAVSTTATDAWSQWDKHSVLGRTQRTKVLKAWFPRCYFLRDTDPDLLNREGRALGIFPPENEIAVPPTTARSWRDCHCCGQTKSGAMITLGRYGYWFPELKNPENKMICNSCYGRGRSQEEVYGVFFCHRKQADELIFSNLKQMKNVPGTSPSCPWDSAVYYDRKRPQSHLEILDEDEEDEDELEEYSPVAENPHLTTTSHGDRNDNNSSTSARKRHKKKKLNPDFFY